MSDAGAIHATALVIGEAGVVIRGPSGSGKSRLASLLLAQPGRHRRFVRLVADDRVLIRGRGAAVIATSHPAIAGLIERRTQPFGILPHEPRCVVRLVVDLHVPETPLPRLPEAAGHAHLGGLGPLPLLRLQGPPDALSCHLVLEALRDTVSLP